MSEGPKPRRSLYRNLDISKIAATAKLLERRIGERFPGSGLSRVSGELREILDETEERGRWIREPKWGLRLGVGAVIALIVLTLWGTFTSLAPVDTRFELAELVALVEAGINDIVLIGAAVLFLVTVENRIKRSKALEALQDLRSLAHVIDMHQLTKDPERIGSRGTSTESSPRRVMSRFELTRYLDYCSELLSLVGKSAALYLQFLDDSVVLSSVTEIENLTTSLSRKIWQKIMILEVLASKGPQLRPGTAQADSTPHPPTGVAG